jgi:hypothetical protein
MTLITTAGKIVEAHKYLVSRGNRALQLLCHDQTRAALSVCHIASTPDPQADAMLTTLIEQNAATIVNDVCDHLADKITRYGREQRQLWIVLAANGFMKSKREPDKKLVWMQEAVDRITRPYYKIMACQEDLPATTTADSIGEVRREGRIEMPNGIIEYMPVPNGGADGEKEAVVGGLGGGEFDPTLVDFDDLAAWTFEDWNFNPGEFAAGFGEVM